MKAPCIFAIAMQLLSVLFALFALTQGHPVKTQQHVNTYVNYTAAHPQISYLVSQIQQTSQLIQLLELNHQNDANLYYGLVGLESYLRFTMYFAQVVQHHGVYQDGTLSPFISKHLEWMSINLHDTYFGLSDDALLTSKLSHWYNSDRLVLEQWKAQILAELEMKQLFYYYPRVNCGYAYLSSGAFWDGLSHFSYTGFIDVVKAAFVC